MEPLVPSSEPQLKRETWRGKFEFIFSLIGFSVGYGNVWLFPYLCYKNGGGCFLLPYVLCIALVGLPMMLLEVALGQFMQSGAITAWNIIPLFQGIGYAATTIGHWINVYYPVILAWNLYYLFASFTSELPWSNCDNPWNTESCTVLHIHDNDTSINSSGTNELYEQRANHEFWYRKVLNISAGIEEPGAVKWDLALCLLMVWILCHVCVWRGTRSTKKIVYFTATAPYVIMLALMIRAVTLDGAKEGLLYFINLDWPRLRSAEVWIDAAIQVLFSYSIGTGAMTALGSYNKYHANMYRDCMIFAVINGLTSVLSGVLIFAFLGFLAKESGASVSTVSESGPDLIFVAVPAAIARVSFAPVWSVLFFAMLFLLGIDSEIQGFVTAIVDWYPEFMHKRFRKEIFTAVICTFWFLIGLSMVTQGGMYVFTFLQNFSQSSAKLLIVVFFQSISIAWFYGSEDFYHYISGMLGFHIFPWIKFCWKFLIPLFCVATLVVQSMLHQSLTYKGTYLYPDWSLAIGWLIFTCTIIFIPAVGLIKMTRNSGTVRERWKRLTARNNPSHIPDENSERHRINRIRRDRLLSTNV